MKPKREQKLPTLKALATLVGVESMASGNLIIGVKYKDGVPGVLSRIAIAEEIEAMINGEMEEK